MKEFYYRNKLGIAKRLEVYEDRTDENGRIFSMIWSMENGELCSSGYNTKEEIKHFLKYYGIDYE